MIILKIVFSKHFRIPFICLIGVVVYLILRLAGFSMPANIVAIFTTILGSYRLFIDTFRKFIRGRFALDYIAILAILVSLYSQEFLVAAILALMIISGKSLEDYAGTQAKKSLTGLIERIPDSVLLWTNGKTGEKIKIKEVKIGQQIFIRKGEVIPLDGTLISTVAQTDESTLTGEPYFLDKIKGDILRSGTINIGGPVVLEVTRREENSTYNKIIELVRRAQSEQSPFVRLADRYSVIFSLITLAIAAFAYLISNFDLTRVLAVLAIATPCPLIIATPIALLGGVNAAAKKRIIIKNLSCLESLAKVDTVVFDKTGTITLGHPTLTGVQILTKKFTRQKIFGLAEALERNSLHPLAKAIVVSARRENAPTLYASQVFEVIGHGISGIIEGQKFTMGKVKAEESMSVELISRDKQLAIFRFEDQLKLDSKKSLNQLQKLGLVLKIFTGDKHESADKILRQINLDIEVTAQMSPEEKQQGIKALQQTGKIVAMVGDGINDAPSLALADVGLVFSNEEQTSASEAADVVFLGGDFSSVVFSLQTAKKTIKIASQSIIFGIGLSTLGMIFASLGFVPPIYGAVFQEVIDVAVILNALRASL